MSEGPDRLEEMYSGESKVFVINLTDNAGNAKDLSSSTGTCVVKSSRASDATTVIYKDSVSTGGVVFTSVLGEMEIYLDPSDTSSLSSGVYYLEVRVVDEYLAADVVLNGDLLIIESATV